MVLIASFVCKMVKEKDETWSLPYSSIVFTVSSTNKAPLLLPVLHNKIRNITAVQSHHR